MGGKDEQHIDPQAKSRKHFEDTKEALKENLHDVKETCNDTADQIKAKLDKEDEKGFWESAGEKLSNAATSVKEAIGWQEPPPPTPTERMKEKLTDFKEACSDTADRVKDKFKSEDEKKAEKSYLDSAGEKLGNAATSVKEAVGWQASPPPTPTERVKEKLTDFKETCSDKADQVKEKFTKEDEKGYMESAGEKLSNAATSAKEAVGWQKPPPPTPTERVKEKLTDFKEACSDQADRVKDKLKDEKDEKSYLESAGEKLSNAATSAKEAVGWQEPPPPTFTERMREKMGDLGSSIKHAVGFEEPEPKSNLEMVQEKLENAAGTVKDTAQDGVDSVRSGARSLKDSAERAYDPARNGDGRW